MTVAPVAGWAARVRRRRDPLPGPSRLDLLAETRWGQHALPTPGEVALYRSIQLRRTHRGQLPVRCCPRSPPDLVHIGHQEQAERSVIEGHQSASPAGRSDPGGRAAQPTRRGRPPSAGWALPPGARRLDGVPPGADPVQPDGLAFPIRDFACGARVGVGGGQAAERPVCPGHRRGAEQPGGPPAGRAARRPGPGAAAVARRGPPGQCCVPHPAACAALDPATDRHRVHRRRTPADAAEPGHSGRPAVIRTALSPACQCGNYSAAVAPDREGDVDTGRGVAGTLSNRLPAGTFGPVPPPERPGPCRGRPPSGGRGRGVLLALW